jgi:hypothetical protein
MYANSTGTNYPVAKFIVTSEMVTTAEGTTLILKCPPSSSKHKLWQKSPLTDLNFTTISDVTMDFATGQFVPVEFAYMRLPTI